MPRSKLIPVSPEEKEKARQELLILMNDADARGMKIPEFKDALKTKQVKWPLASNGYFLRNDGKLYEPCDEMAKFIASQARMILLKGGRGSGKSAAGSQKSLFKIKAGESGAVINPDFANFKISTWPAFKEWIPWNMVVRTQMHRKFDAWEPHEPFTMVFRNGAKVYCKGLKDPGSARGPNINWLWYDEGGRDATGMGFKIAMASVRVGHDPQIWVTETPKSEEHWSYKFFIQKEIPQEALDAFANAMGSDKILVESFHISINDNKDHLDPGFYASVLASYPSGWMRKQEVEGEFANEGGQIGNRMWFVGGTIDDVKHPARMLPVAPEHALKKVRFWDLAATEKKQAKDDPDEAVGTLLSKFMMQGEDGKDKENFCIEHQVAGWWGWDDLLEAIVNTARHDGPYVEIVLEEEPGSGGKNQVAAVKTHFKRFPELSYYKIIGQRARDVGDRVMAANHWFATANEGRMWMVKGNWNEKFLSQLDGFTLVAHDDRVTSVTGAMTYVNPFKTWKRVPFLSV